MITEQLYFPLKNWLTITAIGFGSGCLLALLFRLELPRAAQVGAATIPALVGSVVLTTRQRREQISYRLAGEKSRLGKLQQHQRQLKEYLQGQEFTYQNVAQQVQYLQSLQAKLYQEVQTEQFRQRELADTKFLLERKLQNQQVQVNQIATTLKQRQAELSEVDTLLELRQQHLQNLEKQQEQLLEQAGLYHQEKVQQIQNVDELTAKIGELNQLRESLQAEIVGKEVMARQLEQQLNQLQDQQTSLQDMVSNLNELISQKQSLFQELDSTIGEHQRISTDHTVEITRLESVIANLNSEILLSEQQLQIAQTQLHSTLVDLNYQQAEFMVTPVPTWQSYFADNPHLPLLLHLDKHGSITEAEAIHLLGNPRAVRQFASKISDYAPYLPFSIQVEFSPSGSRYLKQADGFVA
jgi:myosin heavy subunit